MLSILFLLISLYLFYCAIIFSNISIINPISASSTSPTSSSTSSILSLQHSRNFWIEHCSEFFFVSSISYCPLYVIPKSNVVNSFFISLCVNESYSLLKYEKLFVCLCEYSFYCSFFERIRLVFLLYFTKKLKFWI